MFKGVRIAKRGHADTEHAGQWISLEPGFTVYSPPDHSSITVECEDNAVEVHRDLKVTADDA